MAQISDKYVFNNTGIGIVGILSTMKQRKKLDLANALLINSFLLNPEILNFLLLGNIKIRGIEEFMIKFPKMFINFPDRYESLLVMNINCLIIAMESGYLKMDQDYIYSTEKLNTYNFSNKVGIRAKKIIKASAKLAPLLETNSTTLYLNLRIAL